MDENTTEIAEFCIYKQYRRNNYGEQFANILFNSITTKNIMLSVGLKNLPALRFWDSFTNNYCKKSEHKTAFKTTIDTSWKYYSYEK